MTKKTFEKFTVREIVFLAILSAVSLCTCCVMPLVISLQTVVFGIAQLVTGVQVSLFGAIGLMRVRKTGTYFIMMLLTGLFALMMAPAMFFSNIIIGVLVELLILLVFGSYKSDKAVFLAAMLGNPLSLPFNVLYNCLFGREAMVAVASRLPWLTVVMTLAVIAVSALGAFLGIKIARELQKSGKLKRSEHNE